MQKVSQYAAEKGARRHRIRARGAERRREQEEQQQQQQKIVHLREREQATYKPVRKTGTPGLTSVHQEPACVALLTPLAVSLP